MQRFYTASTSSSERSRLLVELVHSFSSYIAQLATARWKQFRRIRGHHGRDELLSVGKVAFIHAVHRWSPSHEKPIERLASRWISYSCLSAAIQLANTDRVPSPRCATKNRNSRDHATLSPASNTPSIENREPRKSLPQSQHDFRTDTGEVLLSLHASLLNSAGDGRHATLESVIPDPATGMHVLEQRDMLCAFRKFVIKRCTPRERSIVGGVYPGVLLSEEMISSQAPDSSFAALGQIHGLTPERVRQILRHTLHKFVRVLASERCATSGILLPLNRHRSV